MRHSRQDGPGDSALRPWRTGFALPCAFFLLACGAAAASDTLGGTDQLPPPGAYFSAYVSDSATGLPLAGAELNIRNPQALFSAARADSAGWAHVSRDGLPYHAGYPIQEQWVTATYPGYVARMATCGTADTAARVFRFSLPRATAKNSITFTAIVLDSATRAPVPRRPVDISHGEMGGWMTYVSTTDDSGRFTIAGIPSGRTQGYFWVRKTITGGYFIPVSLNQPGQPIYAPALPSTALSSPGIRRQTAAGGKPAAVFTYRSGIRDAAGRRRP